MSIQTSLRPIPFPSRSCAKAHDLFFEAKRHRDQRRANPHAVAHLAPVHRTGILVATGGDLVAARQRVHDDAILRQQLELLGAELEARGVDPGALALGGVPLVLDAGHVDGVRKRSGLTEIVGDGEFNALRLENLQHVLWHLQLGRGNEDLADILEIREQIAERADRTTAQQVATERHRAVLQSTLRLEGTLERVDVKQRLGWMLVLAGTGIDDRDRTIRVRELPRHLLGESLLGAAHDDHVDIGGERADRIRLRLALRLGTRALVADGARREAEDLAGIQVREERTGARLGEVEHRPLVGQQRLEVERAFLRLRHETDAVRERRETLKQTPVELLRDQRVVWRLRRDVIMGQIRPFGLQRQLLAIRPCNLSKP